MPGKGQPYVVECATLPCLLRLLPSSRRRANHGEPSELPSKVLYRVEAACA